MLCDNVNVRGWSLVFGAKYANDLGGFFGNPTRPGLGAWSRKSSEPSFDLEPKYANELNENGNRFLIMIQIQKKMKWKSCHFVDSLRTRNTGLWLASDPPSTNPGPPLRHQIWARFCSVLVSSSWFNQRWFTKKTDHRVTHTMFTEFYRVFVVRNDRWAPCVADRWPDGETERYRVFFYRVLLPTFFFFC